MPLARDADGASARRPDRTHASEAGSVMVGCSMERAAGQSDLRPEIGGHRASRAGSRRTLSRCDPPMPCRRSMRRRAPSPASSSSTACSSSSSTAFASSSAPSTRRWASWTLDGMIERVHHQRDLATRSGRRSAPLPRGHGLLGTIIREGMLAPDPGHRQRIRTATASRRTTRRCTRSSASPSASAGEPIGNLYLTEKRDGREFTAQDQELVEMFAVHAGIAIHNARLHHQVQRPRHRRRAAADQP